MLVTRISIPNIVSAYAVPTKVQCLVGILENNINRSFIIDINLNSEIYLARLRNHVIPAIRKLAAIVNLMRFGFNNMAVLRITRSVNIFNRHLTAKLLMASRRHIPNY